MKEISLFHSRPQKMTRDSISQRRLAGNIDTRIEDVKEQTTSLRGEPGRKCVGWLVAGPLLLHQQPFFTPHSLLLLREVPY
jgi:hypothetical protein